MKRLLVVVGAVVGVAAVIYLIYLVNANLTLTDFTLAPDFTISLSLGGLMVSSFLSGLLIASTVVLLQGARRAVSNWRQTRQRRKRERIDSWEERGEQLMWQGDAKAGRSLLEKAWRNRPDSTYAVLSLAASYRATGEVRRERQFLSEAAAKSHHTNPDVLLALARAHDADGDRAAALEVLERLRALHPKAPRVLEAVRNAYVVAGRWQDAVAPQEALVSELRDAERTAREQDQLTVLRYQASLQIEDATARVEALEALAERRTPIVPIAVSLGDALATLGQLDDAVAVWERGLRNKLRSVFVQRLTDLATDNKHRDRLCNLLHKLRGDAVRPDNVRLLVAHLLLLNGKVPDAEKELQLIQDIDALPAYVHRLRAEVYRAQGQLERAVEESFRAQSDPWAYRCVKCRHTGDDCHGRCPACGSWDSHRAAVEIAID